jgi:hypothetical protein
MNCSSQRGVSFRGFTATIVLFLSRATGDLLKSFGLGHCWHCIDSHNGIHVSPTFRVDGLVQPEMSSGDQSPIGWRVHRIITPRLVQEAGSAIAWLTDYSRNEAGNAKLTVPPGQRLPALVWKIHLLHGAQAWLVENAAIPGTPQRL